MTKNQSLTKKLRGKKRKFNNKEKLIPCGMYCYGVRPDGESIVPCPFLRIDKLKHHQNNGVCLAFKIRDDEYGGMLWDWCKECDVNEEEFMSR